MLTNCVKSVKFSTQITPKKGTNAMLSRCRQRFEFAWGYHLKLGGNKPPFLVL